MIQTMEPILIRDGEASMKALDGWLVMTGCPEFV